MDLKSNFYNTSCLKRFEISELDDDELVKVTANEPINRLDKSIQCLFHNVDQDGCFVRDGYVKVGDLHLLKSFSDKFLIQEAKMKIVTAENGQLFEGWAGPISNVTVNDLPDYFARVRNYGKSGYVNCKDVKSALYIPSPITNESIKDDVLLLSYNDNFDREKLYSIFKKHDYAPYGDSIGYYYGVDILNIVNKLEEFRTIVYGIELLSNKLAVLENE